MFLEGSPVMLKTLFNGNEFSMVNLIYLKVEISTYIYHLFSLLVYISSIISKKVAKRVRFQVNINSSFYRILI